MFTPRVSIIFFLVLSGFSQPLDCGTISMISDTTSIREGYMVLDEPSTRDQNGQQFTAFGWVSVDDQTAVEVPLLKVQLAARSLSSNAQLVPFIFESRVLNSNSDTMTVFYNYTLSQTEFSAGQLKIKALYNTPFFVSLGVNFQTNEAKLQISQPQAGQFQVWTANLPLRFNYAAIGRNVKIELSCLLPLNSTAQDLDNLRNSCPLLTVYDFNYIYEYFKNPERLYLLSGKQTVKSDLKFAFDTLQNGRFASKAGSQYYGQLEGDSPVMRPDGTYFFNTSSRVSIPSFNTYDKNNYLNAVTYYFVFRYTEPLPNDFLLFWQGEIGRPFVTLSLAKSGNMRYPSVKVNGQSSNVFEPKQATFFSENTPIKFSFSIVQFGTDYYYIIIQNQKTSETFYSPVYRDLAIRNGNQYLFTGNTPIASGNGGVELFEFDAFTNAAGAAYNDIRAKDGAVYSACNSCNLYVNYAFEDKMCAECLNGQFLNMDNGMCEKSCQSGYHSFEGRCYRCPNNDCTIFTPKILVTRTNATSFLAQWQGQIPAFNGTLANLYTPTVTNWVPNVDYNVQTISLNDGRSTIFNIIPLNPTKSILGETVRFDMRRDYPVYNDQRIPLQNFDFAFFPTGIQNNLVPLNGTVPVGGYLVTQDGQIIPNGYANTVNQYNFYQNDDQYLNKTINEFHPSVEDNTLRLGQAAFSFWIIGLFAGLLGFFFKCPFVPKDPFFYQKFLQTFLMFQYYSFWLLYNARFPGNLENYLRGTFSRSTLWHRIFYESTYYNEGGNYDFDSRYTYYGYNRWVEEGVLTHFVISYGFLFLVHAIVLILMIVAFVLCYKTFFSVPPVAVGGPLTPPGKFSFGAFFTNWDWRMWLRRQFFWKIPVTALMIFIVETIAFTFYNIVKPSFTAGFFTFSFIWALFWFIGTCIVGILVIMWGMRHPLWKLDPINDMNFGFVWHGLDIWRRLAGVFQGIQYLHYWLFSFFLVGAYGSRTAQGILAFIWITLFFLYIAFVRPPMMLFDKIEQIICHGILWLAKFFAMILVWDCSSLGMRTANRYGMGYFVLIMLFILTMWNTAVLIYKLIMMILDCCRGMSMGAQAVVPGMLPGAGPILPLAPVTGPFVVTPVGAPVLDPLAPMAPDYLESVSYVAAPNTATIFPNRLAPMVSTQVAAAPQVTSTVTKAVVVDSGNNVRVDTEKIVSGPNLISQGVAIGSGAAAPVGAALPATLAPLPDLKVKTQVDNTRGGGMAIEPMAADSTISNTLFRDRPMIQVQDARGDTKSFESRLGSLQKINELRFKANNVRNEVISEIPPVTLSSEKNSLEALNQNLRK